MREFYGGIAGWLPRSAGGWRGRRWPVSYVVWSLGLAHSCTLRSGLPQGIDVGFRSPGSACQNRRPRLKLSRRRRPRSDLVWEVPAPTGDRVHPVHQRFHRQTGSTRLDCCNAIGTVYPSRPGSGPASPHRSDSPRLPLSAPVRRSLPIDVRSVGMVPHVG
jgi:hypothetical protein